MAIAVNGKGDKTTITALQQMLKSLGYTNVTVDGVISGQYATQKKYRPAITAVQNGKGGSKTVTALQKWCGLSSPDGIWGQNTSKGLQRKLVALKYFPSTETIDGICGANTVSKLQACINNGGKVNPNPPPAPSLLEKELNACKVQAEWMKNYTYKWIQNPTIANTKYYGTCVSYVAVVLQRIGYLKSGDFIWIDKKGRVEGATSKMTVTYPTGTLKSNKSKLKAGDIVIGGNGKTGAGEGSHIFILTGSWSGDNPYIYDQDSAGRVKKGQNPVHTWSGSFKMIALIRLKG